MPSDMSTHRRVPQQERGERRVAQLLEAAAAVIAEHGYDAATMTEIAERADASIGAVYQYFPNKDAVVRELRMRYAKQMQEHWAHLQEAMPALSVKQIANQFVDVMVGFIEEHPAYIQILDAPIQFKRDQQARNRLREGLASVFRGRKPSLTPERAFRIANVALQIIKGMNVLYAEAGTKEREELVKEYKIALTEYLESRLA